MERKVWGHSISKVGTYHPFMDGMDMKIRPVCGSGIS